MSRAARLILRDGDRRPLETLAGSGSVALRHRARIVLLAAQGLSNAEIARRVAVARPTAAAWRARYELGGVAALVDRPRSGRPASVDEIRVVTATTADGGRPPEHLGATRWSSRLLGDELGLAHGTVARIWRKWGLRPQADIEDGPRT